MKVLYIVFMTLSVALNVFLFMFVERAAKKYYETKEELDTKKKLLFQAVSAVAFYNKNIAKGTPELPKLDPFHGDYR